jgi:hypothetical protein
MKIVYTNLQENDRGIKRRVRQVQLDFARSGDERVSWRHGPRSEDGGRQRAGLENLDLRGQRDGLGDRTSRGQKTEYVESQGGGEEGRFLQGAAVATSLAGRYIRKFLEAQMMTARRVDQKNRINVFV